MHFPRTAEATIKIWRRTVRRNIRLSCKRTSIHNPAFNLEIGRGRASASLHAPFPCGVNRTRRTRVRNKHTADFETSNHPKSCMALNSPQAFIQPVLLMPFPACFRFAGVAWLPITPRLLVSSVEQSSPGPEFHARRLYLLCYTLRFLNPRLCVQRSRLAVVCCLCTKLAVGKSCGGF